MIIREIDQNCNLPPASITPGSYESFTADGIEYIKVGEHWVPVPDAVPVLPSGECTFRNRIPEVSGYVPGTNLPLHIVERCQRIIGDNIFICEKTGEKISIFPGAKRGNAVYAYRQGVVVKQCLSQFEVGGKCLWFTCTVPIDYSSISTTGKSFIAIKKQTQKFLRKMKKKGMVKYIYVVEAYKLGGAHVHILMEMDKEQEYFVHKKDNGKVACLKDEAFRQQIKDCWGNGHLDVQVVTSNKVCGYLVKELCKNSNIERALERAKAGKDLKKNDVNRIWAYYYMNVVHKGMRSWGTSRNISRNIIKEEGGLESGARLDSNMNNSTNFMENANLNSSGCLEDAGSDRVVIVLSREITRQEWFIPVTGRVTDPVMLQKLKEIFEIYEKMGYFRAEMLAKTQEKEEK